MPRFYLHICNGNGFIEDEEGSDLPDVGTARSHAIHCARDVMVADLRRGELDLTSFIEVADEQKNRLFRLAFADAVQIKHRY